MRVKIKIAYNGQKFYGSQFQNGLRTVEGELNSIVNILGINNRVVMGGRTDRGVHATGQVLHLDVPQYWNGKRLLTPLRKLVSNDISIISIDEVNSEFHARYSAKSRSYRYIFTTSSPNPFQKDFISFIQTKELDFSKIEEAISIFKGLHNFKNFRKEGSNNKSDIREMFEVKAYKWNKLYLLKFKANGFLRSQIRMMVAGLIKVGTGKMDKNQLYQQLKSDEVEQY